MDEEKPKKKRKKKAAEGEGGEPKVHKPNWREVYATVEDIKGFCPICSFVCIAIILKF